MSAVRGLASRFRCAMISSVKALGSQRWLSSLIRSRLTLIAAIGVFAAAAEKPKIDVTRLPLPVSRKVDFEREVYPLLKEACFKCHGSEKQKGKYRCDTKSGAFKDTDAGPTIVPGRSEQSALIHLVCGLIDEMLMPPPSDKPGESEKLTEEQVGILRAWIDQGAAWPEGAVKEVIRPVTFSDDLSPILKAHCAECHSGANAKGSFSVENVGAFLKGGITYGAVVKPGNPAKSALLTIVGGNDEDLPVPEKHRLPTRQQALIKTWIEQGAH